MGINTDKNKIQEILSRGVEEVIVKSNLEKKLRSGKKLRIYYGIDPTGALLHLGHSVVLRKLQALADLGHEVILLIGDFTAKIGDPTDKEAMRQPLTEEQVKENMKSYKKQAEKILDFGKIKIEYNSKWLSKLRFDDVLIIAANFTVQQMLERDMFAKRLEQGKPIGLHEFLYPLMQGYDSVAMDVDLEIAGSDQLFNMLAGRTLQKAVNNKEKSVLTVGLLLGTDGRKMSKTYGNFIALTDEPKEMYGKVMSMQDELIGQYFEFCTDLTISDQEIKSNPRDSKAKLAKELVRMYYNEKKAIEAEQEFDKVFKEGGVPDKVPEFKAKQKQYPILDLLKDSGLVKSKGEAKRVVIGGGVNLIIKGEGRIVKDWQETIDLKDGMIVQKGKRGFIKINI